MFNIVVEIIRMSSTAPTRAPAIKAVGLLLLLYESLSVAGDGWGVVVAVAEEEYGDTDDEEGRSVAEDC